MKVALVHEFLTQFGGAERVLLALKELFPNAPIYTLLYNKAETGKWFGKFDIRTSWLQNLPFAKTNYRWYLPLMPAAIQSFDFSPYDLVISDSSAFAKGVITKPPTVHISYIHTPTRYLWQDEQFYRETAVPMLLQPLLKTITPWLRNWDYRAAQRPNFLISNSKTVAARVRKYYNHTSEVIFPFIEAKKIKISKKPKNYFLMAGRIVPYKRYNIVIEAFKRLGLPLVIAGTGWGEAALRRELKIPDVQPVDTPGVSKSDLRLFGYVSDRKLAELYSECRALIFPALEDFGIVPLEAMASGRPVIAYRAGGATETVIEGKTGIFFDEQTPEAIIKAVKRFQTQSSKFDPRQIRAHALQFDKSVFKQKFNDYVKIHLR